MPRRGDDQNCYIAYPGDETPLRLNPQLNLLEPYTFDLYVGSVVVGLPSISSTSGYRPMKSASFET